MTDGPLSGAAYEDCDGAERSSRSGSLTTCRCTPYHVTSISSMSVFSMDLKKCPKSVDGRDRLRFLVGHGVVDVS